MTMKTKTYMGKPCKRGHSGERYVSNQECVDCHKERKAKWLSNPENRLKNRAKQAAHMAERRKDPEFRAKQAAHMAERRKDPEFRAKTAAYRAEWRKDPEFRAKTAAYRAEWRKERYKDPEVRAKQLAYNAEQYKKPEARAGHLWWGARRRSKEKGWEFNLSKERVTAVVQRGVCEATGVPFELHIPRHPRAPSLDRIDSNKPYSDTNVQVVCWAYNAGKQDFSENDYIDFCMRVAEVARQNKKEAA